MTGIGHNSRMSLSEAAEANVQTGVHLLCKEALVTAIQDRRLERGHLKVLAAIAMRMNVRAMAWPGRLQIALDTGLKVRHISNLMLELKDWGYLVAERDTVPEADNKRLTVYTFGNIDHETIRRHITDWVTNLRDAAGKPDPAKSPPTVTPEVTAHGDVHRPRGTSESPPTVMFTARGDMGPQKQPEMSPQAVDSNIERNSNSTDTENVAPARKRGSRLSDDWFMSPHLRSWTLDNFRVTPAKVQLEEDKFRDYWTGKDKNATKLDWDKTWKNWARSAFAKFYQPRLPIMAAPESGTDNLADIFAKIRAEEDGEC